MQKVLISAMIALGFANVSFAQGDYDAKVRAYIEKYRALAVAEQKRSGIPASITLAQGIHETQAGNSELATMANNHFGIKCKKEWTGETFAHTDDAPNECFRKYSRSEDSYKDHTDYLVKSPRYAELFKLSITDYPSWAIGLRKCGYATNPRYAQVLIKLVEDYHLQEFTYAAMNNAEIIPDKDPVIEVVDKKDVAARTATAPAVVAPVVAAAPIPAPPVTKIVEVAQAPVAEPEPQSRPKPQYGSEVTVNGLRAIYGRRGETPLGYAYKANVRYSKLLDINEIDERPLPFDMYLYLERKHTSGLHPTHTVGSGETLFMVAQEEGIQIKELMEMNLLQQGEEPLPGTVLELQRMATDKPSVTYAKKNPVASKIKTGTLAAPPVNKPVVITRVPVQTVPAPPEPVVVAAPVEMQTVPVETVKPVIEPPVVIETAPVSAPVVAETVKPVTEPPIVIETVKPISAPVADPVVVETTKPVVAHIIETPVSAPLVVAESPKVAAPVVVDPVVIEEVKPVSAPVATPAPVISEPVVASATLPAKPTRMHKIKSTDEFPAVPVVKSNTLVKEPAVAPVVVEAKSEPVVDMPKITKAADPVAAGSKGYPEIAEPRYAIDDVPAKSVTTEVPHLADLPSNPDAPESASASRELPITETPASLAAAPVKERPRMAPVMSPKQVAVPAAPEEPKDELDRLKKKFDRVVYADDNSRMAAAAARNGNAVPVQQLQPVEQKAIDDEATAKVDTNSAGGGDKYYTVKKGDTGFNIAKKNNISLSQLMKWNNMDFGNLEIKEGQKLKVKP